MLRSALGVRMQSLGHPAEEGRLQRTGRRRTEPVTRP